MDAAVLLWDILDMQPKILPIIEHENELAVEFPPDLLRLLNAKNGDELHVLPGIDGIFIQRRVD